MPTDTSKGTVQTVGNYDLVEKIAEGGMGTVYKARDRATDQIVAIKLVSPQMAKNPVFLQRFEKEYNVARSLDHPNIIRALDFGTSGGRSYLVMEFVDGESIGQRLERVGRMPESEAIHLIGLAARGLEKAHKEGLIHRDIKPDNIMVNKEGEVKIADLGLVKELETDINLTRTGRGLGTPHFMAPEQFRNAKNADVRCDVYSLAATLYMMVTGQMPFHACGPLDAWMRKVNNELTPPKKLNLDLSDRVDAAIRRAMNADPEQRPADCKEFMEDLTGHGIRKVTATKVPNQPGELWYLLYKDEDGKPHMVKGTVTGIRRSLKEGLLGDASNVKASRAKNGQFQPIRGVAQFKDIVKATEKTDEVETPLAGDGVKDSGKSKTKQLAAAKPPKDKAPHIPLETDGASTQEWVKLCILVGLAISAGVVIAFLLQNN